MDQHQGVDPHGTESRNQRVLKHVAGKTGIFARNNPFFAGSRRKILPTARPSAKAVSTVMGGLLA